MQRFFLCLAAIVVGCLSLPANLTAQDAAEFMNRGDAWCNRGDYDKGIANYDQALRLLDPNDIDDAASLADLYCNRGKAWHSKGEFDKAIADYDKALVNNPGYAPAYARRGAARFAKGEYDKALADENQALALDDKDINAYADRGAIWFKKGDYNKAESDYRKALTIINIKLSDKPRKATGPDEAERPSPLSAEAYYGLGNVWDKKEEYDSAFTDYTLALTANPTYADAYYARGNVANKVGEFESAIADYNQALSVNPKHIAAYNALGWLHATCPDAQYRDGKKAFENASKAYQLDGGEHWPYLETLAAAYAERGDFKRAKENEAKAINLLAADKSATDKDKAQASARLELYTQGKPYHQELPKK